MKWNEKSIARAISLQTFSKKCVLLVDNCNWTGHECDVLGVTMDLRIIDIEIKISRSDLKADAKKEKWWDRKHVGYSEEIKNYFADGKLKSIHRSPLYESNGKEHPRKVWKHYYAVPKDIWKPDLLEFLPSSASGILLLKNNEFSSELIIVDCHRRAKPNKDADRLKPEQVMDIARLANLRMWESYRMLDSIKGNS